MKNVLLKKKYRLSEYDVAIWRMPIMVSSILISKSFLFFKNHVPSTASIENKSKILL